MKPMLIVPRKSPSPPPSERLAYSIKESSQLLGCSERSIRTWIKCGKIRALKIGCRVFIPETALRELFDTISKTEEK